MNLSIQCNTISYLPVVFCFVGCRCFNGHKNWILGWYADRAITVDPSTAGAWHGTLVAFVDYDQASNTEYVLIKTGDLYIQYNMAKKFNSGTKERRNQVTIVTAKADNEVSSALAGLSVGEGYWSKESEMVIEVCRIMSSGNKDSIEVSIRLSSQRSSCSRPISTLAPRSSLLQVSTSRRIRSNFSLSNQTLVQVPSNGNFVLTCQKDSPDCFLVPYVDVQHYFWLAALIYVTLTMHRSRSSCFQKYLICLLRSSCRSTKYLSDSSS